MRNLYRILRLFKCPHKWETLTSRSNDVITEGRGVTAYEYNYFLKCRRCGDIKHKKFNS